MGFWSRLFGNDTASAKFSSEGTVPPSQFAARAVAAHANCTVPISGVVAVIRSLDKALIGRGMPRETMDSLWYFSLIGLCPKCGAPCGAEALKMLVVFDALGGSTNITLGGGGGEAARLRNGLCSSSACESRDMSLFWCPDIDPQAVNLFRSKGLELEDCSSKRHGIWPV